MGRLIPKRPRQHIRFAEHLALISTSCLIGLIEASQNKNESNFILMSKTRSSGCAAKSQRPFPDTHLPILRTPPRPEHPWFPGHLRSHTSEYVASLSFSNTRFASCRVILVGLHAALPIKDLIVQQGHKRFDPERSTFAS